MFTYVQAIRTEVFRAYSKPLQPISAIESFVMGAGIAQSVECLATVWMTGLSRIQLQQTQRNFLLTSVSIPALGPTQLPVQWVPGFLSLGAKRGRGVALTTHPHLVPLSWMCTSYTSSLLCVSTGEFWNSFAFYFKLADIPGVARDSRYSERIRMIKYGKKDYFAKVNYNDDFYNNTSFSLTYSHIHSNINYIKILF
jgi:hypothetical protein